MDQELIDVGDSDEQEIEIDLDQDTDADTSFKAESSNPNIADQMGGEDDDPAPAKTPQERFDAFSSADPEAAAEYSQKVQKRIDTLTYKYHEEERQKKAAIDYAEGVRTENSTLRTQNAHGQLGYFQSQHSQLIAELSQAKSLYKEAHSLNDPDLMAEASENISTFASKISNMESRIVQAKSGPLIRANPNSETLVDINTPAREMPTHSTPAPSQPAARQAEPDSKAQSWAEKNEWFGTDQNMTEGALAIHRQMIGSEGYLPTSDAYYSELDSRVRRNFPDQFTNDAAASLQSGQSPVTPVVNGNGGGKPRKRTNKVKLSASQVAIAKKLGVPLEEYAKYV
jgi:hypothetical protein